MLADFLRTSPSTLDLSSASPLYTASRSKCGARRGTRSPIGYGNSLRGGTKMGWLITSGGFGFAMQTPLGLQYDETSPSA